MKNVLVNIFKVLLPIALGGGILYWMYRDFDFARVASTLRDDTNWWLMAFSLLFGVSAQVFRGLRWQLSLEPLGENPRVMNCIHAIFISYTTSLVIPRSGEVTRCGILTRYDGTSFSKALGTVVTERVIDSLIIAVLALVVFLLQMPTFITFFEQTGTSFSGWFATFSATGYVVTVLCVIATALFLWYAMRRFQLFKRFHRVVADIRDGIFSLRHISRIGLFAGYTAGIWISYFLHFYITFFCFPFTSSLSLMTALVAFVVGSFAVIVPTPNGMGSWHFAVKTILLMSGVRSAADAEMFVLIVHAIQTALMPLLGIYSAISLLSVTPVRRGSEAIP